MTVISRIMFALGLLRSSSFATHLAENGQPCIVLNGKTDLCFKYNNETTPHCYVNNTTRSPCANVVCEGHGCTINSICRWNTTEKKPSCKCNSTNMDTSTPKQCTECISDDHCGGDQTCQGAGPGRKCIDPCLNPVHYCADMASCHVSNHQPHCECPTPYKLMNSIDCELAPSEFVVLSTGQGHESSCFAVSPENQNWDEAKSWCERHSSTLAQFPKDLDLLQEYISTTTNISADSYWLGARGTGVIMAWTKGAEVNPSSPIIWEHDSSKVNSTFCTLYIPSVVDGKLSSQNCSDKHKFICKLDRCDIPKIVGKSELAAFTETSITVSLPAVKYQNTIQSYFVVVGEVPKPDAEEIDILMRNNHTNKEKLWITAKLNFLNYANKYFEIGTNQTFEGFRNTKLVNGRQYYVALVVATKQGEFTLYKSSDLGGPYYATEYKGLSIYVLLGVTGATSVTLWLAMGIHTVIQRCLCN